jgi:tRNA(fMet)-specific endonuclease VapC
VFDHLKSILPETACTSIIVSAEIRFGLCKGALEKLKIQTEKVLDVLDILPLEKPVDEYYGKIRTLLNQAGQPIGGNDLLIAAHALALNLTLVSANVREFSRVPSLRVENWLEK